MCSGGGDGGDAAYMCNEDDDGVCRGRLEMDVKSRTHI